MGWALLGCNCTTYLHPFCSVSCLQHQQVRSDLDQGQGTKQRVHNNCSRLTSRCQVFAEVKDIVTVLSFKHTDSEKDVRGCQTSS